MSRLRALRQRWQSLQKREQRMLFGAVFVLVLAVLWWLAVAPALKTQRDFAASNRMLEHQLQHMQQLRQQALSLQQQGSARMISPEMAVRQLQASATRLLGEQAHLTVLAEQVNVRLDDVAGGALLDWLKEIRETSGSQLMQLDLNVSGAQTVATSVQAVRWRGTLLLALPGRTR